MFELWLSLSVIISMFAFVGFLIYGSGAIDEPNVELKRCIAKYSLWCLACTLFSVLWPIAIVVGLVYFTHGLITIVKEDR